MNILVVGNGRHAKRRVVPALKKISTISTIDILDRKANNESIKLTEKIKIKNAEYPYRN